MAAAVAARAAQGVDFAHEVVPILRKHCGECHTGDARQGGFSLNTREDLLAGGDSGTPGLVPGESATSELVARI
ncbi:MAG: c-type cytochrome domain-containing protein, partial [Planctomycetota bacterium]